MSDLIRSATPAVLRLGGAFLQLLVTILIARELGAAAAGIYFFWSAALMEVGQVATFGLDRVAMQRVPRFRKDPELISQFLAPLRMTALALAFVGAIGLCCYALFFQADMVRPAWWYVLPILAVTGITLCMINGEAMTGQGRPVLAILYRHTLSVVALLTVVLLVGENLSPDLALAAYAGAFFLSGFGALFGPGMCKEGRHLSIPTREEFKSHFVMGSPIFVCSLFAASAFVVPLAILEQTHSSAEIAFLTTSFRIFVLIDVLARAIHSLVMPELSIAAEEHDRDQIRKIYRNASIRGLAILGIPILFLIVFARPVMAVFGEGFGAGSGMLQVLLGFGLLSLALGPAHQLLLMVGHTKRMAFFSFLHFLFTSILGLALVPKFGALGLACILGAGIALEKIIYLVYSRRAVRQIEAGDGNDG